MATQVVYWRGSYEGARDVSRRIARLLAGDTSAGGADIARGVNLAVGVAALSDIKADFIRKSRGGTGEDGEQWAPLSREYLAYNRRFGAGEKSKLKKAAGLGKEHRFGTGQNKGLLTAAQLKRWNGVFSGVYRKARMSMGEAEAKAKAAAFAWADAKRHGARTMLDVFGNREVEILRDTGVLFNSLSPGELTGGALPTGYSPPGGQGGSEQILKTIATGVHVGTTVAYAAVHQHGSKKKNIPARPFLPRVVPASWAARWVKVANRALIVGARLLFQRAAQQ